MTKLQENSLVSQYNFKVLQDASDARSKKINKIELLKELKTPMSFYHDLKNLCERKLEDLKEEEKKYLLKCFGFFLKKDGTFMLRARIISGHLSATQAFRLGQISKQYANNYMDITTRSQIELRFLKLEDLYKVVVELDSVGITTFQTGIDNFRAIVTSAFDGYATDCKISCIPIISQMTKIFLKNEEYMGTLPRKFNTGILGTTTNDCNIYGHDCSFILARKGEELGFNLYLGGKVGVQAHSANIFVKKDEVATVFKAVIDLFKTFGFRDNRNKNRLHFLLEAVGMEEFTKAIKAQSNLKLEDAGTLLVKNEFLLDNEGIYELIDKKSAVHFSIPSGILSGDDLVQAGELALEVNGFIKLSVEQSFYIITNNDKISTVKQSLIYKKYDSFHNIYFNNLVACAGTATCSFAVIANKPDAIDMAKYLHENVPMNEGKIRLYWSACPKGCGLHSIADIGFEGCIAKDEEGNKCEGVHIFLGGKASKESKEARLIVKSTTIKKAKELVKNLVVLYKNKKIGNESFESFDDRVLSKLTIEEIREIVGL